MKVTQNNSPIQMDAYIKQIQQQRSQQQDLQSSNAAAKGTTDKVHLSEQARQIQSAALELGHSDDIRQDKVQQVRMDIEKGTYTVNAEQLATDMLKEAFENNKALKTIDMKA